jgi:hypothetical protein
MKQTDRRRIMRGENKEVRKEHRSRQQLKNEVIMKRHGKLKTFQAHMRKYRLNEGHKLKEKERENLFKTKQTV